MKTQYTTAEFPAGLENFDRLPDAAYVRQPVVEGLMSCSSATVWRRVKSCQLPQPKKFGAITAWNVGELRKSLNAR